MERLKQLRAWQQRQQADLLRQQQEQLFRLRSEQQTAMREQARNSSSVGDSETWGYGQMREGEEEGDFEQMLSSLPESPSSVSGGQCASGPDLAERIECSGDVGDPGEHFDSSDCENHQEIGPESDNEEPAGVSRVSTCVHSSVRDTFSPWYTC